MKNITRLWETRKSNIDDIMKEEIRGTWISAIIVIIGIFLATILVHWAFIIIFFLLEFECDERIREKWLKSK